MAENIYQEYVLPFINGSQTGEEICFISTSTFFGFRTLGAANFEAVCAALVDAKTRGVKIRLIVSVHDEFTCKAAEGLLTFLSDNREIRHFEGNEYVYALTICSSDERGKHVAFKSGEPQSCRFLPGIQVRPFLGTQAPPSENLSHARCIEYRNEFDQFWNQQSSSVIPAILRHSPLYRARDSYRWTQTIAYLGILITGFFAGVIFTREFKAGPHGPEILVWLLGTLLTGVATTLLSDIMLKRFWKQSI